MKSEKKRNEKIKKRREKLKKRRYSYDVILGIYKEFLRTEEKDFKAVHKFGKEEIEKIGVSKFIKAIGFNKKEDVSKWRTDALHLVICPECQKNFGIYEFYSICPDCETKYDMEEIHKAHTLTTNANKNEANPGEFLFAFMTLKELRNFYLKDNIQVPYAVYALKYNAFNQSWVVSLLQDLNKGDIVKFIMSSGETYKEGDVDIFEIIDIKRENDELSIEYNKTTNPTPVNALSD